MNKYHYIFYMRAKHALPCIRMNTVTTNAIQKIWESGTDGVDNPVVQVIAVKKIQGPQGAAPSEGNDKYRFAMVSSRVAYFRDSFSFLFLLVLSPVLYACLHSPSLFLPRTNGARKKYISPSLVQFPPFTE